MIYHFINPNKRLSARQVLKHPWIVNEKNASEREFGDQYLKQMKHWQSLQERVCQHILMATESVSTPLNLYCN